MTQVPDKLPSSTGYFNYVAEDGLNYQGYVTFTEANALTATGRWEIFRADWCGYIMRSRSFFRRDSDDERAVLIRRSVNSPEERQHKMSSGQIEEPCLAVTFGPGHMLYLSGEAARIFEKRWHQFLEQPARAHSEPGQSSNKQQHET